MKTSCGLWILQNLKGSIPLLWPPSLCENHWLINSPALGKGETRGGSCCTSDIALGLRCAAGEKKVTGGGIPVFLIAYVLVAGGEATESDVSSKFLDSGRDMGLAR